MFNKIKSIVSALKQLKIEQELNDKLKREKIAVESDKLYYENLSKQQERTIERMKAEHKEETRLTKIAHDDKIRIMNNAAEELQADFNSKNKIKDAEMATTVSTEVAKLTEENNQLKIDKGILEMKVDVLESAFKNLGFDVKDMKGMLDKLVDGIVSKSNGLVKIISNRE